MMPNLQLALNQQFQQGVYFAQQAMVAEQTGNWAAVAPCYDQAIGLIGNAIGGAVQSGMPVFDNVYFSYAFCHFNAARVKAAMGWPQAAPMHLMQAFQGMQQAIAINPGNFQYHSALGVVILAQGNVAGALQSFQRAVQLNPADSWSQWMLASLYSTQGATAISNQYYAAAVQVQPNLPHPQQYGASAGMAQGAPQGQQGGHDWFGLINNALKLANSIAGAFEQQGGQTQQQPMWNQQSDW